MHFDNTISIKCNPIISVFILSNTGWNVFTQKIKFLYMMKSSICINIKSVYFICNHPDSVSCINIKGFNNDMSNIFTIFKFRMNNLIFRIYINKSSRGTYPNIFITIFGKTSYRITRKTIFGGDMFQCMIFCYSLNTFSIRPNPHTISGIFKNTTGRNK